MKYPLFLLLFLTTKLFSQQTLEFNRRYVECEDKWVVFKPDKDSSFAFGFIYIDWQAGLTLNYEGTFKISPSGEFIPKKLDSANMKVRLKPNNVLVAFIPENKFQELQISIIPDWLIHYKTDTNSVARLYRWGYMYNGWNECSKALTYLERAEKIDSRYKGLAVELAFSYNCLKQYEKAETILEEEIKTNSTDPYVNKEYIYTLTKNKKIEKASEQFFLSLKLLKDNTYNAENCYNILQFFYTQKDKKNFFKWYSEFQKHPNENKLMTQYATNMKNEMSK